MQINLNFDKELGKIKPLHCTNMGPRQNGTKIDFTAEFKEIGIPYTRLHDVEYPYGRNQYVDIHCIFPDFDADETKEEAYNFSHTDKYLKAICDADCQIFYRLGESIDHFDKQLYVHPPKDFEKWARICEHIIAHYNEGWANGFEMGIEYWEIWNEPDNPKMWTGTNEQFFELYRVTANHLKERFGNSIKVGGYASSGFYVNNRTDLSEWLKTLVPYMHDFFEYINDEKTYAPMDFFSWHCYAETPEEIALHAKYAKELLEQHNREECESILNEFNMYYCFSEYTPFRKGCFADFGAILILAQKSPVDMLMHYGLFPRGTYNNLFNLDIDGKTVIRFAGFETFKDFGHLYRLGSEVQTQGDVEGSLYTLAAKGSSEGAVMIVSREYSGEIEINISGGEYSLYSIKRTDDKAPRGAANISYAENKLSENKITTTISKNEILLIRFM